MVDDAATNLHEQQVIKGLQVLCPMYVSPQIKTHGDMTGQKASLAADISGLCTWLAAKFSETSELSPQICQCWADEWCNGLPVFTLQQMNNDYYGVSGDRSPALPSKETVSICGCSLQSGLLQHACTHVFCTARITMAAARASNPAQHTYQLLSTFC